MAGNLGPIPIPDPPVIGNFPLKPDYSTGTDMEPPIAIHVFDQPGLRTEQRYLLGNGARRFRVTKDHLSCNEYDLLKAHFAQAQGSYAQFPYTHPRPDGNLAVTARYENPVMDFQHLVGLLTGGPGITLLEVPSTAPAYTSAATVTRFPDAVLTAALESQVQEFVPLIVISPRDGSAPAYISNRACSVDGKTYIPRLLDWNGIAQTLGEASDSASFSFGNADDVFVQWGNQINLYRATIQLAFFHVNTNYRINFWGGYARPWQLDSNGQFALPATDGVFELTVAYPSRQISRFCWKAYKGRFCPSTSSYTDCPKSFDACTARGVPKSFGGVVALPQTVRIMDNSTGILGWGRSQMTSVSISEDTIYQRSIQEVWTDEPMRVTCDVATGRDESDFYSALGIVSEGPIGLYDPNLTLHKLDDQPPHDPLRGGGWRGILGDDPAGDGDYFGLDQAPWVSNIKGWIPSAANLPTTGNKKGDGWLTQDTVHLYVHNGLGFMDNGAQTYAAGVAFAEIRRTDAKGLQLSSVSDRAMSVVVDQGIGGWQWTAPGQRYFQKGISNTIWVAINVFLRGIGLRLNEDNPNGIMPAEMEQYFDVNQAIAMAAICDLMVDKLVGDGQEKQFPFRGVLKERKPLKDWLQEILNCCLGYYTFVDGKLWVGIRINSSVLPAPGDSVGGNAYNRNSILWKSLNAVPLQPSFNWLTGEFGDEEFDFALNSVTINDMDAASYAGSAVSPQFLQSTMNFVGVSNKSQCARLITTRLREEIGGTGPDSATAQQVQRDARNFAFRTTFLAMQTMVGDVVGLSHSRVPNGRIEGRVQSWQLNPDFSIDIKCSASHDSMYALDAGPKPVDALSDVEVPELLESPNGLAWMPNHVAPFDGDPLYPDLNERTFDLWQDYNIERDGGWSPAIWVGGEPVINEYAAPVQPRIVDVMLTSGGTLNGPLMVYLAVTQRDSTGQPSTPSNLTGTWIPAGATNQRISIEMVPAAGAWDGWDLYAGTDRRRIAWQGSFDGNPASYDFDGPIHPMTEELPEAAARRVQIRAKHVWHSGVAGILITGVPAANQIQCDDFIGATDQWVNRICSALADFSDGSAPLWNFRITGFNAATGTLTVSPDCVRADPADSVQEGDVLIVRSIATSAGPDWVEDTLWNNSVGRIQFPGTNGLRPDEEQGRIVRILRGTGAGQIRYATGNSNIRIQLHSTWDTIPDATSIVIVEAADWDYVTETSDLPSPRAGNPFELRLRTDNLADRVALVGGFLIDDQGRITDEEFAVFREIYIFGEPPGVRAVGPGALDPNNQPWQVQITDQTIRVDTSRNDVTVQLLPIASYQGRTLYFANDNGPNNAIVQCASGEFLFDGQDHISLAANETVRLTAG